LQLAAWVAIVSAVSMAPLFLLQVAANRYGLALLSAAVQFINVLLFVFVLSSLRKLLARRPAGAANGLLSAIITVTVIVQCLTLFAAPERTLLGLALLVGMVALGGLYVFAGIRLLGFAADLPGLKLFSYAAIAVGICTASVILALLAFPASIVMNVALAIIFFRQAGAPAQEHG